MSEELIEFMQISIKKEETEISEMIKDIIPIKEKQFTNIELDINKNENFSLVIYKKRNPIIRFFAKIKISLEKIKIIQASKQYEYAQNQNNSEKYK